MPQAKRKKRHTCKNHSRRVARGRCPTCRQWICRECAVLHEGKFYCKDTCSPKQGKKPQPETKAKKKPSTKPPAKTAPQTKPKTKRQIKPKTKPETEPAAEKKQEPAKPTQPKKKPQKKKEPKKSHIKTIIFWAGLTIGFGGLAFGLFEMKKTRELKDLVQMYKESRSRLINLIKKRNAYIRKLKEEREAAKQVKKPEKKKLKRVTVSPSYVQPSYEYSPEILPVSFDNGISTKKLIALTFDGGGYPNAAVPILDTLRSREVPATMFLTGGFIKRNTDLVRKIIACGHEIGNHTSTHPHLTSWPETRTQTTLPEITSEIIGKELYLANKYFKKATGFDMLPLWRAPYGEKNREICLWARQFGYLHIGWKQARYWRQNFDTNDWIPDPETPGYYTPEETLKKFNALADLQPYGMNGAIILMHLGTQRKQEDQRIHLVLGILIDQLREKGYEFVPVTVLLKESGVDISLLEKGIERG